MTPSQASDVAELHRESIKTGLTASLGRRFCKTLYLAMASTPYSFILVCEDGQKKLVGFICCATNTSKMYRDVIKKNFFPLLFSALIRLFSLSILKQAVKAIRRPKKFKTGNFSEWQLPEAEIVSIAVSPQTQGQHIGTKLIKAAFDKLKDLGHFKVRTWTSEDNKRAVAFYQRQGFEMLGMRQYHTGGIYVFVANLKNDKRINFID